MPGNAGIDRLLQENVVAAIGKMGQPHNRERVSVTSVREKVTFLASQEVSELTITVFGTDAAVDDNALLAICFDAYDDDEADLWLTETDLESFDSQRFLVRANGISEVFNSLGAIERVDFKAVGAETLRVVIGGV